VVETIAAHILCLRFSDQKTRWQSRTQLCTRRRTVNPRRNFKQPISAIPSQFCWRPAATDTRLQWCGNVSQPRI